MKNRCVQLYLVPFSVLNDEFLAWSYWLSTSSSTMITVSLVHARLVCRCCFKVGAIFENLYFTR